MSTTVKGFFVGRENKRFVQLAIDAGRLVYRECNGDRNAAWLPPSAWLRREFDTARIEADMLADARFAEAA